MIRIMPFLEFDRVSFWRYGAAKTGRARNAGIAVNNGNGNVEDTLAIRRVVYALLAINNDAVLFQVHDLQVASRLDAPISGSKLDVIFQS